jgi:diaminohydroxyphosphoribosylaminopyrimidine deaminase/5-amino-6-(5-phosphoribosylamino)uracil reductase
MRAANDEGKAIARDERFMRNALAMARRGLGTTAPNPSVGAVVVDDADVIVGRGVTQPGGRPHAERVALDQAGEQARGATLYVTLEPCSHHGRTPPCADAVIAAGIRRVVCGIEDPHEVVAGEGLARLRAAGIEVIENVFAAEARWLTLGHILRVTAQRPFVQLKLAVSGDGRIARGTGHPVWVTGEAARARGHLLRAQADAILIGSGTLAADDPRLDCRLPGLDERSPWRVVLDSNLSLSPQHTLCMLAAVTPVFVVHASPEKVKQRRQLEARGVQPVEVPRRADHRLDLALTLEGLAVRGVTRLLVEGGPRVWRSFLDAGLVDEIVLFEGQGELGESGLLPFVDAGLERIATIGRFAEVDRRDLGGDKMRTFRRING